LEAVPLLEQFVRALAAGDGILNLLIAVDHFGELHGQIILIPDVCADRYRWSDANRRCRHMGDQKVNWLAKNCVHME
jgi:hypothetical protein